MGPVVNILNLVAQMLMIVIIGDVVLTYVFEPYHPARVFLDKIVHPFLRPIQKLVPPMQGIDFSPVILILVIQLINWLLARLLLSIR